MSSLFGDLFKAPGGAKSDGLFSEHSKFKASREPVVAAQASKPAKSNKEDKGSKRKREAAAAEPAPQKKSSKKEDKKDKLIEKAAINPDGEPKTTAAAAAAGEGKSNKGRAKQAAKVSAAAAKARTATEETTNKGGEPNVAASALQNASKKVENRKGKKAATAPGSASEPVKKQKLKAIQKEAHALKKSSETRKVGDNKPSLASAAQNEGLGGKSEGAVDGVGGEAEKLERTIFVGNVPPATKRKALAALFSQYGPVESVRLRCVPLKLDAKLPRKAAIASGNVDSDRGAANAYIVFQTLEAATAALEHNMKEFEGHHLRVDKAALNKKAVKVAQKESGSAAAKAAAAVGKGVVYDPARSVFIGNLHLEAEDEELIRFLIGGLGAGAQNEVEAVRIVRDPKTSLGKGIAFALFKSKMGRKTALALDGRELKGRPLRVTTIQSGGGPVTAGRAGAAWQGATATKTGRMRGLAMKKEGKSGKLMQKKGKGPSLKKQSGGKRPAVAAKKAKQLLAKGGKKKH